MNASSNPPTTPGVATGMPLTEDDIARYLLTTPDFFVRHAGVLTSVQMTSPHGNRAVVHQHLIAFLQLAGKTPDPLGTAFAPLWMLGN